jgi:hypothetical protein
LLTCRGLYGGDNFTVASTTTDVTTQGGLDLRELGLGMLLEEFGPRHQHARDAVATLHGTLGDEAALKWVEPTPLMGRSQTLNRRDVAPVSLASRYETTHDRLTIEPDRTCTALTFTTPLLRSG